MSHSPRSLRSSLKTTPRATRHARPVASYEEPVSDIDEELYFAAMASESETSDRPLATRRSAGTGLNLNVAKTKRPRQESPSPPAYLGQPTSRNCRPKRRRKMSKAIVKHKSTKTSPKKQAQIPDYESYSSGVVPPWPSLPYQILLQIFQFAAYPLYDEFFQPTHSTNWLLKVSRICRTFAEPALTALYVSPPLVPMERAHKLRQLVMSDHEPMSFNYRVKIENLQIEVSQTAGYSLGGYGKLDLYGLIYNCPRLVALELYHQKDMPPYKGLNDSIKWTYPDAMFVALASNMDGVPTKLQSWRWSSRLGGKRWPVERLEEVHLTPSFHNLRKIAFANYQDQVPILRKNEEDPEHEKKIAKSLSVLPDLEYLIFDSSTIVNATLLPLLPNNLKHLELINCWEVLAEDMAAFLVTHGAHLETLTLNHNQSLSLSFLTVLAEACPRLKTLKMNLTYYNIHSTYHDSEPFYKQLLLDDETPTWPSSLQVLELTQLRKWDVEIAKVFFESLLGSANCLSNLRSLTVKAIINTSWRERSTFRDTWVGAFDRVFKRRLIPPNPHLRSIGAFENWKKQSSAVKMQPADNGVRRRRRRLSTADSPVHASSDEEPTHYHRDSPKRSARPRTRYASQNSSLNAPKILSNSHNSSSGRDIGRSITMAREISNLKKTAGKDAPKDEQSTTDSSSEPDTPSDDNFTDSDDKPLVQKLMKKASQSEIDSDNEPLVKRARGMRKGKDRFQAKEFIQGMCDLVLVRIDNLRPTEMQFREADFLDSEPDGDADWDGNDDDDAAFAW